MRSCPCVCKPIKVRRDGRWRCRGSTCISSKFAVLFGAPQIPAGIGLIQWIPQEEDRNPQEWRSIQRNGRQSTGIEDQSTGMEVNPEE